MLIDKRLQSGLASLSDPIRRSILELLRDQPRSAGAIATQFPVSWPAVSRHLRVLKQAGLIEERRVQRQRIYSLKRDALRPVAAWVNELAGELRVITPAAPPERVVVGRQAFS
jgi:DNA-binding transcriptional ArsR family regulator